MTDELAESRAIYAVNHVRDFIKCKQDFSASEILYRLRKCTRGTNFQLFEWRRGINREVFFRSASTRGAHSGFGCFFILRRDDLFEACFNFLARLPKGLISLVLLELYKYIAFLINARY